MATNPKLDRLIELLAASTLKKELAWERTTDENSFRADFPTGAIRVNKSSSANLHLGANGAGELYSLTLLDKAGDVSDEYQPENPGTLSELFSLARASAFRTDELVDSFITLLENPPRPKGPGEKLAATFSTTDQHGRTHIVDEWVVLTPAGTATEPGRLAITSRSLRTRNGHSVQKMDKGVYKVVGTDLVLRSDAS